MELNPIKQARALAQLLFNKPKQENLLPDPGNVFNTDPSLPYKQVPRVVNNLGSRKQHSPTPLAQVQTAQTQPQIPSTATGGGVGGNSAEIERKMRAGLVKYGGEKLPILNYVPQFIQAAQKYPVFQQNPYLLPQISILESSGGRNVTRANNPLNWAARVQAAGNYSPSSWDQSIQDAITAIGGDYEARKGRESQADYYKKFRTSGSLQDFANTYEPANPDYLNNLTAGIKFFEEQ